MSLSIIKDRLLALHPGAAMDDELILNKWFNEEVSALFLAYAVEHNQSTMQAVKIEGEPLHCHETCLKHCTLHPDLVPWFGLVLLQEDGVWRFWVHSRATTPDLSVRFETDPTATHSTRFVGLPWTVQLWRVLRKAPNHMPESELPPVLRRDLFKLPPPTKQGREWVNGF